MSPTIVDVYKRQVQGGCDRYCDERCRKREIEIFYANRDYKELVEILDIERGEKFVDLRYNETGGNWCSR